MLRYSKRRLELREIRERGAGRNKGEVYEGVGKREKDNRPGDAEDFR
jgi:hypothetical protein